jgi:hypothetical protein
VRGLQAPTSPHTSKPTRSKDIQARPLVSEQSNRRAEAILALCHKKFSILGPHDLSVELMALKSLVLCSAGRRFPFLPQAENDGTKTRA